MNLQPVPYHTRLKRFLKERESELWKWLTSSEAKAGYAEQLRQDLLKSTYRLDAQSYPVIYEQAERAKEALGLSIPVTIYQGQQAHGLNAGIYYLPGEAHIVLTGPILQLLKPDELLSVLAHELGHYQFWDSNGGEFHIMDRLVGNLASSRRSTPSHFHTARNVQLYTEIYCDRASLIATGDLLAVVRSLMKIHTGMPEVNPESYLKQAEEVFQNKMESTVERSHPEAYIRGNALSLWHQHGVAAEEPIAQMIEGPRTVDELDLLGQENMTQVTRQLINDLLQPTWFQTDLVLAHARLFFPSFSIQIASEIPSQFSKDPKTMEYLSYVLLDFAVIDPELEQEPLKEAMRVSKRWEVNESFAKLAQKELKIKAREWEKIRKEVER